MNNDDLETRILRGPTIEYENEAEAKLDYEYQQYHDNLDNQAKYKELSSLSSSLSSESSMTTSTNNSLPYDDILREQRQGKLPSSGPKAVLADKAYADKLQIFNNDRQHYQKLAMYQQIGQGNTLLNLSNDPSDSTNNLYIPSVSLATEKIQYQEQRALRERHYQNDSDSDNDNNNIHTHAKGTVDTTNPTKSKSEEDDDDNDDEFNDDQFFAAYRKQRMEQLQLLTKSITYGTVTEIKNIEDLPTIIDTTNPNIYVLCLLYETYIPACTPWRIAWKELAIRYPTQIRFICMQTSIASTAWDPISLPALGIYKNKLTIGSIVRLQEKENIEESIGSGLGNHPDTESIELWLMNKGWLPNDTNSTLRNISGMTNTNVGNNNKNNIKRSNVLDDDDDLDDDN